MCGIFALLGSFTIENVLRYFERIKHRGPDSTSYQVVNNLFMGFHRLAINDLTHNGDQPMTVGDSILICNGEIYNHRELAIKYGIKTYSRSDCEIILHLYNMFGIAKTLDLISGYFAFVIYNTKHKVIYVARDPVGVRSLYIGYGKQICIASEMKAIPEDLSVVQFPPGKYMQIEPLTKVNEIYCYWDIYAIKNLSADTQSIGSIRTNVKELFVNAVHKRFMTDRPFGVFLSGGLDSSLVAAIVAKKSVKKVHSFSIGLSGSTDLKYAKLVADHIGTIHHEVIVTEKEMLDAIPQVIKAIESYDTTTVRASTPMWLLSQYISKNSDIKVVFSGEGSDELCGGYLYFHKAPSTKDFEQETRRLVANLSYFDCLRGDKSTAAHGLEIRVPFLDREFMEYYISIPTELKMPNSYIKPLDDAELSGKWGPDSKIEKWFIRSCFDEDNLLPTSVLWRKKEAFSDGVSSTERSWFKIIQEHVDKIIIGDSWKSSDLIPKPLLKESYYYRTIFDELYPGRSNTIPYYWLPKWSDTIDPSARTLK